jgi:hypothetical protein
MNWYKISQYGTLQNKKIPQHYSDLGHREGEDIYLWFIDRNWNMEIINAEKLANRIGGIDDYGDEINFAVHDNWSEYLENRSANNLLAAGRYDQTNHSASYHIAISPEDLFNPKIDYIANRVEKKISRSFNDPRIFSF